MHGKRADRYDHGETAVTICRTNIAELHSYAG